MSAYKATLVARYRSRVPFIFDDFVDDLSDALSPSIVVQITATVDGIL